MTEQKNQTQRRGYRLGRRRELVDQTRDRIAAATYELHATIGPAQTTISAVAKRAGVQRHTVYHHFPDLRSLFEACTAHGLRVTGFPRPDPWREIADPTERLPVALLQVYRYYRANERLMANVLRDMPVFADIGGDEEYKDRVAEMFETLATGWDVEPAAEPALRAAIGHAMAFETWRSLTAAGITDERVRDMMVAFVLSAASPLMAIR